MSAASSASSDDEDDSDDAASHSSDSSDGPDELDLDLDGSDEDGYEQSDASEEKSDVSEGAAVTRPAPTVGRQTARRPASPPAAAAAVSEFSLRRSRRRSVPVRHLQVDPHRISYVSV